MKKVVIVLVIILGIIVLILSRKNNISSQPARATESSRPDKPYCVVNGNGTITYGTSHWKGWFLFGHWESNPGASTMPGGARECAGFLEAV